MTGFTLEGFADCKKGQALVAAIPPGASVVPAAGPMVEAP